MKCKYCGKKMDLTEWEIEFENIEFLMHTCPHCRAICEEYFDGEGKFKELWITYIDGHKQVRLIYTDCLGNNVDTYI